VGDEVKRDEPIFEISTDKVDAEIPSPTAGTLAEILVQEGQTVAVQTIVARIETEKGAAASAPAPSAPAPTAARRTPRHQRSSLRNRLPCRARRPGLPPDAPTAPAVASAPSGTETADERLRRRSTPLVRKMAAEHQLDIGTIPGTGHAGRVTKNDLLGWLETKPAAVSGTEARPTAPSAATAPSAPRVDPWPGDRVEPWSRIRKLTADHMIMSKRVSAHVSSYFDVDYTHITQLRARKKKEYASVG
jgi:2-oxoglutarate dehydrogenase E2 component (dihydrolipoamide succinyltransferase)